MSFDYAPLQTSTALPVSHVRAMPRGAAVRVYGVVTRLLRLSARLLFLFPVLLVAKAVLFFQDNPLGDYVTVGFVLLVVVFFAFFSLTILLYAIVGPRSKRTTKLVFAPPAPDDLETVVASVASLASLAPSATTRTTGRIEAKLESGQPVLVEEWSHGEELARFVEGRSFAVVPDDPDAMPCIVEIAAAPVLLARYAEEEEGAIRKSRCVLRQGQRVAIVARPSEPSTRVEDARLLELIAKEGAAPYRGSESPGIVVRSTPADPVVIQLLD